MSETFYNYGEGIQKGREWFWCNVASSFSQTEKINN
jgi:hypothetical protein